VRPSPRPYPALGVGNDPLGSVLNLKFFLDYLAGMAQLINFQVAILTATAHDHPAGALCRVGSILCKTYYLH
jgi:hypothetical protein